MIKHDDKYFVAKPRFEQNSCKGCWWYPTTDVMYRERYSTCLYNSIDAYLLSGCLRMHKGQSGSVCKDLNIIFVKTQSIKR